MSDNDTIITVPSRNIQSDLFGPLNPSILVWLKTYVTDIGGSYSCFASDDVNNIPHVSFRLYNVPNATRRVFAEMVGGKIHFVKTPLYRRSKNSYKVYIPEASVSKNFTLNTEVFDWLHENFRGCWTWSAGDIIDGVQYSCFRFDNVDKDIISLFKLTFS